VSLVGSKGRISLGSTAEETLAENSKNGERGERGFRNGCRAGTISLAQCCGRRKGCRGGALNDRGRLIITSSPEFGDLVGLLGNEGNSVPLEYVGDLCRRSGQNLLCEEGGGEAGGIPAAERGRRRREGRGFAC